MILVKNNLSWVRPLIDAHREDLDDIKTMCPFEHALHGITIPVEHKFRYTYNESGEEKYCFKTIKVYLHIYFNGKKLRSTRLGKPC